MSNNCISIIVKHETVIQKEELLKKWVDGIMSTASKFTGYLGTVITEEASDKSITYTILYRFNNHSNYILWKKSNERKEWIKKLEAFETKFSESLIMKNLSEWFQKPIVTTKIPKYKMMVVTWFSVFPLMFLIPLLIKPFVQNLPKFVTMFISSIVMVIFINLIMMPFMLKRFSKWLNK